MDEWDLTCKDIIDKYDPNQTKPVQYLNEVLEAHHNQPKQLLHELHLRLKLAKSKDRRLANAVSKLQNNQSNKDRVIERLKNLFPADPAGDPINFIPEAYRPPTLSCDLTVQLLGLAKEVVANGLDISVIWAAADSGGLILQHMRDRRNKIAREVVTPHAVKLARQNLKRWKATQGYEAVPEASLSRVGDTNSDAFTPQSSTFEIGRSAPPELSPGFESEMDDFGLDNDLEGTIHSEERDDIGLYADMDKTMNTEENDMDIRTALGRKRHSSSCIDLVPKRIQTAATSLGCLEAGVRVNDECLNSLLDLAIGDHQQAFAAMDPLTLRAHAQAASAVGSKAPSHFMTGYTKIEHLLLPYHHVTKQHWTLFVYHKSETLLVHYDSISDSIAQKALAQVYSFLTWLYQVESLDYQIETRRVAHQSNSFDCGVYVIETARCLAAGIDPEKRFSQVTASQLRGEYTRAITDNRMEAASLHTDLALSSAKAKLMAPVQVQPSPVEQPSPFLNLAILLEKRRNEYEVLMHYCAYLRTSLAAFRIIVKRRQSLESELELSSGRLSEARDWLAVNAASDIAVLLAAGKAVMSSSTRQHQVSATTQAVFASLKALEADTLRCTEVVQMEEKECRRLEGIMNCHAGVQEVLCLIDWVEKRCEVTSEKIAQLKQTAQVCEDALAC